MGTTREDIRGWLERGKAEGATHLIVVCDTYEWSDYPVFVKPGEDAKAVYSRYHGQNMQKVMEVYKLDLDWDFQLRERRAYHL